MSELPPRHFLDLCDDTVDAAMVRALLDRAHALKRAPRPAERPLAGRTVALIFQKPSTRTRVSFEVGVRQLGGDVVVLNASDMQLGRGETVADTARVLSRYVDAILLRTDSRDTLLELARHATVPVVNGLTDRSHPCQVIADLQTLEERRGPVAGQEVAWVGDGNNVAESWIHAAVRCDLTLRLACPPGYEPPAETLEWARQQQGRVTLTSDPVAAVRGAGCVITDTWVSMNQVEAEERIRALTPYRVDATLMAQAAPEALFLHCLPAHRGDEVTDAVLDGPQSGVWDEAENRLHAQKAILLWCFQS